MYLIKIAGVFPVGFRLKKIAVTIHEFVIRFDVLGKTISR